MLKAFALFVIEGVLFAFGIVSTTRARIARDYPARHGVR